MKFCFLSVVCLFCLSVGAQQSSPKQQKNPPKQEGGVGKVRNERNATMPQTAKGANAQAQNELVGCIGGSGQNLVLTQPRQRRTYQLRGDQALLQGSIGKMVKVTGKLLLGDQSAFEVHSVERVQDKCEYETSSPAQPVTGKTGVHGTEQTVTSTKNPEQVTPGVQTEHGVAQNPSNSERADKRGAYPSPPSPPTASQAAPPNPNVQSPEEAQRVANAAHQAELKNPQAKLGAGAQPDYSSATRPEANAQSVANQAQENRGQASGSEQVFKGGQKQAPPAQEAQRTQRAPGTAPVFTGCLTQEGNDFWLTQQGSNERFRVAGEASKLKEHLNHKVQIVGNKTGTYGPAIGASGGDVTVHLQAIQDLAPTCGK